MSNADCSKEVHYGKRITENMFCAASPDWSTDACKVRDRAQGMPWETRHLSWL